MFGVIFLMKIVSKTLLLALFIAAGALASLAQTTTPSALVADLYKQHDAQKSPFFQEKSRALVEKYFTKSTAALIWKDATTRGNDIGALGADPLYDAQDVEIKGFTVGKAVITGDKATVAVKFTNFGEKKTINFSLIKEGTAWKIQDIDYGEYTLVGLFNESEGGGEESSNFKGAFRVGPTTCHVTPVKMAFEVRWVRGSGVEMFFAKGSENGKVIFEAEPNKYPKRSQFIFDDESLTRGIYLRGDGRKFSLSRS